MEQFLRADILTQRGLCTKENVHRCLYTLKGFYMILRKEGSIYTQMLCTKMFLRAWIKAHRVCHFFCVAKTCVKALLCKGFFVEKILRWHRKTCTHRLHRFFYRPTFLHAETVARAVLHSRNFLAQKHLRTKKKCTAVFTDRRFFHTESSPHRSLTHRRFYEQHFLHTDAFTYWCIYTGTNCRQKLVHTARVYTANFCTERLHFPFLITYVSCSPSQVLSGHGMFFVLKTMILDMSRLAYHERFETAPSIEMTAMGGPLWNIYWRSVLLYILVIVVLLVYTYNTKMHICACDT